MKRKSSISIAISLTIFLSGCSVQEQKAVSQINEVDYLILDASQRVKDAQNELYMAGAINSIVINKPAVLTGESLYSFTWEGDAVQLLNKIAHDKGVTFSITGTRLPLPLSINVKNKPYNQMINAIQSQIGYRANIIQNDTQLTLDYNNFTH